ncbi:MAG TPA: FtsQ-type POTRA domain-containing protein [Opitutaceae bacterium]|nr:FtsQ-type POTRA domain-containing protein [Opitutaceae bacterium]
MSQDSTSFPVARSWREIPQPALPRGMSREGRWRLIMAIVRLTAATVVLGIFGWGLWLVVGTVRDNTKVMPAVAKATPMKPPILRTDGVLDDAWLARTLALRRGTALIELDLDQLRRRLLADDQVINATLTRRFPDQLIVQVAERSPVARVMTQWLGQKRMLLVARDGVIYAGTGYDPALLDTLPWLDGVSITTDGPRLRPIAHMSEVEKLLGKARLEAEHLYATWQIVSLAQLESDHRIDIRTSNGLTIIFNTRDDYFRQLAKLDYITDQLARYPGATASIDLSLGRDVPVSVTLPAAGAGESAETAPASRDVPVPDGAAFRAATAGPTFRFGPLRDAEATGSNPADSLRSADPVSQQTFFALPNPQPNRIHREL